MPTIKKIRVRNFRALEFLELDVKGNGVKATGWNKKGKTSLLKAIRSLTSPKEIGPEAIRRGATEAEVFLDLGDVTVQRSFNADGKNELEVRQRMGELDVPMGKPATVLKSLFGDSLLDPVELFLADKKERRNMVLGALPCTVTVEQLCKWVPGLPKDYDCKGHGLDVVARLHGQMYDARKQANAKAKDLRTHAKELAGAAELAEKDAPKATGSESDARTAVDQARARYAKLEGRETEAKAAEERSAGTRREVEALRAKARAEIEELTEVPVDMLEQADGVIADAEAEVADIERRLAVAQEKLGKAKILRTTLGAKAEAVAVAHRRSADYVRQAEQLEKTLAAVAVTAPTAAELEAAVAAIENAQATLADLHAAKGAADARRIASEADATATTAEDAAARLDKVVDALANEAPRELVAKSGGIPGLTLAGDTILLDGTDIDRGSSGAEQLEFAVEIARRANAKSKVIVCDGLEKIDGREIDRVVELATRDGYQLFATRVEDHDLVFEQIGAEPAKAKGEEASDGASS